MLIRNWKTAFLLTVIVPMSLLTTFRFTGMLREPRAPEIITVDTVSWSMNRPFMYLKPDQIVANQYSGKLVQVQMNSCICSYHENEPDCPSFYKDYVKLWVGATARASAGFIYSLSVKFVPLSSYSSLIVETTPSSMHLYNVVVEKIQSTFSMASNASFVADSMDHPKECSLRMISFWVLLDDNSMDHALTVILEAVYFDGSVYQKAVIPINLQVLKP